MPKTELIILAIEDSPERRVIEQALDVSGFRVEIAPTTEHLEKLLRERTPSVVAVGEMLNGISGLEISANILERFPTLPVVLVAQMHSPALLHQAIRAGVSDCLMPPLAIDTVTETFVRTRKRANAMGDWIRKEIRRNTQTLEQRIKELETLVGLGRQITGSLDLDSVLTAVVNSAVQLTGAEGGALLLQPANNAQGITLRATYDPASGMARTLDAVVEDALAEQALKSGETVSYHNSNPRTILGNVTAQSLIYVPLLVNNRALGLLGIYQRETKHPFRDYDFLLMTVLADYAAIAIENARLYQSSQAERLKLETTLNGISEGVIVLDEALQVIFINPTACAILALDSGNITGQSLARHISQPDLAALLNAPPRDRLPRDEEMVFEDGRVFTVKMLPVSGVGWVLTIQDITNLKMMDRIKSDFIHTVSHDLRSPLTAILGYVELLERIGPLNSQQREFVRRVQSSVHSITALVNDLLDLGRIEAGFDASRDQVLLQDILHYTLETFQNQVAEKQIRLTVNVDPNLPAMRGNPIRLRQLLDNLLGNAIKYTPQGGSVQVSLQSEDGQIILKVADTGVGIPLADQPHIFEKFYRASNTPPGTPGTGLGLAIVKSIVENHQGRIWLTSTSGQGSTFYVVLPIYQDEARE